MNERHQAKIHGETLFRAEPVHPRRRFSPDRLRNPSAAGGRLFYVDQSDLHRPGHGVGLFHIKPDSAQKCPAVSAAGLRHGRYVDVPSRGQISLFSNRSRYNASPVVSVLCAADSCAAVQPVRSAGAWTAGWRRHFRPVAFAIYSRGAADLWRSDQRSASDGV